MKEKTNLQSLLVALLLILAGTLSPSNGLDERVYKTPLELIQNVLVIVSAGLVIFFVWYWIESRKESAKSSYKSDERNTPTSN